MRRWTSTALLALASCDDHVVEAEAVFSEDGTSVAVVVKRYDLCPEWGGGETREDEEYRLSIVDLDTGREQRMRGWTTGNAVVVGYYRAAGYVLLNDLSGYHRIDLDGSVTLFDSSTRWTPSPDGRVLASDEAAFVADGTAAPPFACAVTARFVDAATLTEVCRSTSDVVADCPTAVVWGPDGRTFYAGGGDNPTLAFDLCGGAPRVVPSLYALHCLHGSDPSTSSSEISADGMRAEVDIDEDGAIRGVRLTPSGRVPWPGNCFPETAEP